MGIWEIFHITLAMFIVLASAAVWYGVKLESSHDRLDKERGERILLNGLFWETILALVLIFVDTVVSYDQRATIAALEWQNKNLTTELLHVSMPRSLNAAKFREGLKNQPKATFEVLFVESSSDAPYLALSIWRALKQLGWASFQTGPMPLPPSPTAPRWVPRAVAAGGNVFGITVVSNQPFFSIDGKPNTASPTFELATALALATGSQEEAHSGLVSDMPNGTFRIVVGARSPSGLELLSPSP